jgi:hypothetical protein
MISLLQCNIREANKPDDKIVKQERFWFWEQDQCRPVIASPATNGANMIASTIFPVIFGFEMLELALRARSADLIIVVLKCFSIADWSRNDHLSTRLEAFKSQAFSGASGDILI